jgi:inner membrane protein YidH
VQIVETSPLNEDARMDDPLKAELHKDELRKERTALDRSARTVALSTSELADSSDRRTILASDRTLLAAERTYAAWVRTALAAIAAGIGARALVKDVLPQWVGKVTGTVLVIFAGFCLVAAVWREIRGTPRPPEPDIRTIPAALLVPMNLLLLLVAAAALVGIWSV